MRIFLTALLVFTITGCASYDVAKNTVRDGVQAINDRAMNDARKIICNNVYDAEGRYRKRFSINADIFNASCGRTAAVLR